MIFGDWRELLSHFGYPLMGICPCEWCWAQTRRAIDRRAGIRRFN